MGICGSDWGRFGLSQLGGTFHPTDFSLPLINLIGWRRLGTVESWAVRGTSMFLVVGSVGSSAISS